MSVIELYLIETLPGVSCVVVVACLLFIFFSGLYWVYTEIDLDNRSLLCEGRAEKLLARREALRKKIVPAIILIILMSLIPSRTGFYRIYAGHLLTNTEGMSQLPDKSVAALNKLLDGYLGGQPKNKP